jgi:eukaryotic-like serine/threonine-protein kinase
MAESGIDRMSEHPGADHLKRLRDLLNDALDHDAQTRAAWLQDACGDDEKLRAQVEALLVAHATSGVVDDVVNAMAGVSFPQPEAEIGRRLGPYRIAKVLGFGGMGAVYLGERADGQFEQRVALKIMRSGWGGEESRRRFVEERQILARLEHPHIARLLDGGLTEAAEPYFAMEYVEGKAIDEFSEARSLSVEQRLDMFLQVCGAVQHAHESLIVHRDLKPSNILVTASGQVKLLDFGIAKLLDSDAGAHPAVTQTRMHWLTPQYASPEQIRGEPVTTASDVYALGLVLYRLLTGQPPYEVDTASAAQVEAIVCNTEPVAPSITAHQLRRVLEGDLDTIVLKALRKEPAQRYRSAEQLAGDIKRHLAGLPILARPATLRYRSSKFVRRHRVGLAFTALVTLLLIGGIVGTSTQARRAREQALVAQQERDRARVEATKAHRVSTFLASLFQQSDPRQGGASERTAREILDRGAAWVRDSLAQEPEVQAEMMNVMGVIYKELFLYDPAESLFQDALSRYVRLHGENYRGVATALDQLGNIAQMRGNYGGADSLFRRALAIDRQIDPGDDSNTATIINNMALLAQSRGDLAKAEQLYEQALVIDQHARGSNPDWRARTLNNLGSVRRMRGNYDSAEPALREALAIKLATYGRESSSTANTINQIGVVQHARGEYQAAETSYREALAIRRKVVGDTASVIAMTLADLSLLYFHQELYAKADSTAHAGLQILRASVGEQHPWFAYLTGTDASIHHASREFAKAERLYRSAIQLISTRVSPRQPGVATNLTGLGILMVQDGRAHEAEPLLREALSIRHEKLNPADWKVAETENALGAALSSAGRTEEAAPFLLPSYERLRNTRGTPELARRRAQDFFTAHQVRTTALRKAAR